jgi:hypothetical protein
VNPAANVVAVLLIPDMRDGAGQRPHPRLRTLLVTLEGAEPVAGHRGFRFADAATGKEARLAGVP